MDGLAHSATNTGQPLRAIEDAYQYALSALENPQAPPLDAVIWMCAHLAAVQHVVERHMARLLDGAEVGAFHRNCIRLERTLRTVEQLASGDALASRIDAPAVLSALAAQVREQAEQEHRLLDKLTERMAAVEQRRLVADYERALAHAPTRPHPHTPHGRTFGWLAFRFNGARDRIMDTLDSRPTPTPHKPRKPIKSTRWGDYFLGVTNPGAMSDRAEDEAPENMSAPAEDPMTPASPAADD